ncbi:MAG: nitroreductase/quinone reductase family protein [Thermomicrobiales bacterium]
MPTQEQEWNAPIIAEFRANGGVVAAPYPDPPPMLLVHTLGARSGREHIVPMRARVDGQHLYIFASAHGSDRHPDWYYNLLAHPDIVIEQGSATIPVHAAEVTGAERERIFRAQATQFATFADYEQRLNRVIPVMRLTPR